MTYQQKKMIKIQQKHQEYRVSHQASPLQLFSYFINKGNNHELVETVMNTRHQHWFQLKIQNNNKNNNNNNTNDNNTNNEINKDNY